MSSKNGFVWPTSGPVEALDWNAIEDCGNGLHGWLHGHGDGSASTYWSDDCKWLVVNVKTKHMIDLGEKVKFKKGEVVFCGDRKGATDYILANDPIARTRPVIGAFITTGDQDTSVSGYKGTSTSGVNGTIIIRYWKNGRYYSKVGHIGEGGLEPNVAYKLDENHNFVKA